MSVATVSVNEYELLATSNANRISRALDVLSPLMRKFQDQVHMPILGGSVCVDCYDPQVGDYTDDNTARLTVIERPAVSTLIIDDIATAAGKRVLSSTVLFADPDLGLPLEYEQFCFEGFSVDIRSDAQTLYGHMGGGRLALTTPYSYEADSFASACLIPLENRSHT